MVCTEKADHQQSSLYKMINFSLTKAVRKSLGFYGVLILYTVILYSHSIYSHSALDFIIYLIRCHNKLPRQYTISTFICESNTTYVAINVVNIK